MIQTVDPFLSSDSIEKGSRWSTQLKSGLSSSAFGIICLTQDNLQSPWMTFEAGALSEGLSSDRVCPLLVDVEPADIQGPMGEFQGTALNKTDMFKLISTINRASDGGSVEPARLAKLFDALWPELEAGVNAARIAHTDRQETATKEAPSSRTFKLLASRGTLINPSDDSRNIAFKVDTVNLILGELASSLVEAEGLESTQAAFDRAGYAAAAVFAERIHERWGLEHPEDTISERIDRWCVFDSDVGWGRLVNELEFDESGQVSGGIRLIENFQTYKRGIGRSQPDCYLMHGYVRGVLETLLNGAPLKVQCDPSSCPLSNRMKRDCTFLVESEG